MIRLIAALRRLHRDRSGQYTFIALFGAIPFVMLMVQIINIGSVSLDRMKAQNAADAIAQSHAVWTARSLNTIAANNTTMAQTATVGVASAALHGALVEAGIHAGGVTVDVGIHAGKHCGKLFKTGGSLPFPANLVPLAFGALCAVEHLAAATPALDTIRRIVTIYADYRPDHGLKTANKATKSLSKANERVVDRAQAEIGKLLEAVARANGTTQFYVHRDCDAAGASCSKAEGKKALKLPLEASRMAIPEMCILSNSKIGGINFANLRTFMGYTTFTKREYARAESPYTHGGSSSYVNIPDHIVAMTKVSTILYAFDRFYRKTKVMGTEIGGLVYAPAINAPLLLRYFGDHGSQIPKSLEKKTKDARTDASTSRDDLKDIDLEAKNEDGTDKFSAQVKKTVGSTLDQVDKVLSKNPLADEVTQSLLHLKKQQEPKKRDNNFFTRLKMEWGLLCISGALSTGRDPGKAPGKGGSGKGVDSAINSLSSAVARIVNFGLEPVATPTLFFLKDRDIARDALARIVPQQDEDFSPDYKPLVFVYHQPALRVGANKFFGMPARGSYAVAEAITYNTAGFDLYSQEWDGRLAGISQLDDMNKITRSMDRLAERPFDKLRKAYEAAVNASSATDRAFGDIHAH